MVVLDTFSPVDDLDPDSPDPLWQQLANGLRADIAAGALTGKLPSEEAIAQRHGVSRDTVRRALGVLREEGLVASTRGRGSFVRRPAP